MDSQRLNQIYEQLKSHEREIRILKEEKIFKSSNKNSTDKTRKLVHSFFTSNWCHGLPRVVNATNNFSRLVWSLAIIIATLICGYIITNSITDFLNFNTVIEIKNTRGQPIAFPQITICHFYASNIESKEDAFNFKMIEKDLDFKVVLCLFDGKPCKNAHTVGTVFFQTGFTASCLKFNGENSLDKLYYQKSTTAVSGYTLIMSYTNQDGFINAFINDIHEAAITSQKAILINNKNYYTIELEKIVEEKLGYPYSDCIKNFENLPDDNHLIKKTIELDKKYTREKCYFLCFQRYGTDIFNCTLPNVYKTNYNISCRDVPDYEFVKNKLFIENDFDYEKHCLEECPIECKSSSFKIKQEQFIDEYLLNNTFGIRASFPNLEVKEYVELPKTTISDLIAKIGGTLGVFIGFRFLSFIDIFEFICKYVYYNLRPSRREPVSI